MINSTIDPKWAKTLHYGGPEPRYFKPLVFVNKQMHEAEPGYVLDRCFLPPTILQLDECEQILRVNDAQLDLKALMPCLQSAAGVGAPTNAPSEGYLPFYVNVITSDLYAYAGGSWYKTT